MSRLFKLFKIYLPVVIWAGIIFLVSAQSTLPGPPSGFLDFIVKKVGHITVYAILFTLTHQAVSEHLSQKIYARRLLWLPLLFCILYAISDEIHQSFVPGRHPTFRDIGFDTLGAVIAWLRRYRYI